VNNPKTNRKSASGRVIGYLHGNVYLNNGGNNDKLENSDGNSRYAMTAFASWGAGPDISDISLPAPRMEGGKPLMQALKNGRQRVTSVRRNCMPRYCPIFSGQHSVSIGRSRENERPPRPELAGNGDLRDHGGWCLSLRPACQQTEKYRKGDLRNWRELRISWLKPH